MDGIESREQPTDSAVPVPFRETPVELSDRGVRCFQDVVDILQGREGRHGRSK
jgi:hypothetical protein